MGGTWGRGIGGGGHGWNMGWQDGRERRVRFSDPYCVSLNSISFLTTLTPVQVFSKRCYISICKPWKNLSVLVPLKSLGVCLF